MGSFADLDVRKPEYTGENRCWPCTVVNVALLSIIAAVLWIRASAAVAVLVAVAGLAVVWLWGYLIPGTPQFGPRLVAAIPGGEALFHEEDIPEQGGSLADESVDGDELLSRLVEAGVLELDNETVAPTSAYDERWRAEIERLQRLDTDELAEAALELSPATEVRVVRDDDEWIALSQGDTNVIEETWLTRPVTIAEVAGYRAAESFLSDHATRLAAAQTNRMFLDHCPDCGTALKQGTDMSCCGGHTGAGDEPAETLVCPACAVRLYTFEPA